MNILPLINVLLNLKCGLDPRSTYQDNARLYDGQSFDYIVVGGGSAGCVIAGRLSENYADRVLLLEAGDYPTVSTEVPSFAFDNIQTEIDWNYETERGNYSLSLKNAPRLPRGKVLGGSGSINGMMYMHSLPSDYNTWAALGNAGWDYKSVLKYFHKAENTEGFQSERFGKGGPISLTRYMANDPVSSMLKQSLGEIGVPILDEEGGAGYFPVYRNIGNGTRSSTAKAYLANLRRKNLHMSTKAHVLNIIIKKNRAVGVRVSIDGRNLSLFCNKEVILSAGTINTPQILQLSGIGPAEHLKELGIPVVANLPVGKNLLDHYMSRGFFIKLDPTESENKCVSDAALQYCVNRDGPFTFSDVANMLWSLATKNQSDPEMFVNFVHSQRGKPEVIEALLKMLSASDESRKEFSALIVKHDVLLTSIIICSPKSTGVVRLRSTNPHDPPRIYPNYMSDAKGEDVQSYIDALAYLKKFVDSPSMRKRNAELVMPSYANCKKFAVNSREFYECVFRYMEGTGGHMTTTCKMGPRSDSTTVVDGKLRVHGIDGLRVVDASVMPTVPNRNTNAPTIMIAEKASDIIKSDWNLQ